MSLNIDSDRAQYEYNKDQFNFVGIAQRLAPSLLASVRGEGLVVGIEGEWGSGKTTLLNYLNKELSKQSPDDIHTITITPWLNGDNISLVSSLLNSFMHKIEEIENQDNKQNIKRLQQLEKIGNLTKDYSVKTARVITPYAQLAGNFFPTAALTAKVLEKSTDILEGYSTKPASELKAEISKTMKSLDIGFVVLIDDLDRLEPAQAVEIVRLVKSVADFPNVVFILCYDRKVLAKALENGLGVHDGNNYLQKIIQLSFAIPLPEPFELREQFRTESVNIFEKITNQKMDEEVLDDLRIAIDREGVNLKTPREVKLALNGIRFIYPSLTREIYYPDLCSLYLIKLTNHKLYRWLEEYLSIRSIIITGDGNISTNEKKILGKKLKKLLPADDKGATNSIWNLSRLIPGVRHENSNEKCVFSTVNENIIAKLINKRRLGSPLHYRFYFALQGPKTVLSDEQIEEILSLAKNNCVELCNRLKIYASNNRVSGRSWYEHILDRLDSKFIENLDLMTAKGLIISISNTMDFVIKLENRYRFFDFGVDNKSIKVMENLLLHIKALDIQEFDRTSTLITSEGQSISWIAGGFIFDQLFAHGRTGENSKPKDQWIFTDEQLTKLTSILKERLTNFSADNDLLQLPKFARFLYAWSEISCKKEVTDWIADQSKSDAIFLKILMQLRHWSLSDKLYRPLSKRSIEEFYNLKDALERVEKLCDGELKEKAQEVQKAIKLARN